jgi:16S rRNA (cytosine967-C5)-methyltransferase
MQSSILKTAAGRVRVGGQILYSTCSIEPLENERIVQQFLATYANPNGPTFRLVEEERFIPGNPADGAYQALIERVS